MSEKILSIKKEENGELTVLANWFMSLEELRILHKNLEGLKGLFGLKTEEEKKEKLPLNTEIPVWEKLLKAKEEADKERQRLYEEC